MAALVVATAQASAQTPADDAVAGLSAQRLANGLPADIVERPDWSEACAKHMRYLRLNHLGLSHDEDRRKPGYSPEGARAGANSVLQSPSVVWKHGYNPWENAPFHLMQTLAPALAWIGFAPGCQTTWPGYERPLPPEPVLLSYPGDQRAGVRHVQVASELPFVPGDFVGLPQGTATGPHLMVFAWGLGRGRLVHAALTGTAGPLEVRTVDNSTPQAGGFMPPGGIIVAVKPLLPLRTYTATATFQGPIQSAPNAPPTEQSLATLTRTWSFTTAALVPGTRPTLINGVAHVTSGSRAPATLTITRASSGEMVAERQLEHGQRWNTKLIPDRYRICASQPAKGPYAADEACALSRWHLKTPVALRRLANRDGQIRIAVRAHPALLGLRAEITDRRFVRGCAGCPPATTRVRRVTLRRSMTLTFLAPSRTHDLVIRIRAKHPNTDGVIYRTALDRIVIHP